MASGDIFYSSVDPNLQKELNARANAGFTSRTNKDLDFMLGKIGNVEIRAYTGNSPDTRTVIPINEFGILGGKVPTTVGSYLPSGNSFKDGFLRDGSSYRIPPIITLAEINIGDHTMGLLNKASVNITIPDPTRDFDNFEKIWFRPGRHATIIFEYPNSAVITSPGLLSDDTIPSEEKLKEQFPNDTAEIRSALKKMNRVRFDGLITSFQFSYQQDGSVESTISLTGTSNVYTDVSMLMQTNTEETGSSNTDNDKNTGTKTFYNVLKNNVNNIINKNSNNGTITNGEVLVNNKSDHGIIWGPRYNEKGFGFTSYNKNDKQNELKYVTLGYLIDQLNKNITKKLNSTVQNPAVICNDEICFSNVYPELVSADPTKILLWPGTNNTSVNEYKSLNPNVLSTIIWLGQVNPISQGFINNSLAFPSRIYIEMQVIKQINENTKTLNDFLKSISATIYEYTGGAINMNLITHPKEPDKLLYYDAKYQGNNKSGVEEFVVPMFAQSKVEKNQTEPVLGTIVTEVKVSSKLPDNMKNLSYVLNEGTEISESDIAPFVAYMYADDDQKQKILERYKQDNEKYLLELQETKFEFSKDPESQQNINRLKGALVKYIQYPTDDIEKSNLLSAPVYPFDVEFTIDGINGFKYGDVLEIPILPTRYSEQTIFSVINVVHTIDNIGLWSTKIKCIMRPRITK